MYVANRVSTVQSSYRVHTERKFTRWLVNIEYMFFFFFFFFLFLFCFLSYFNYHYRLLLTWYSLFVCCSTMCFSLICFSCCRRYILFSFSLIILFFFVFSLCNLRHSNDYLVNCVLFMNDKNKKSKKNKAFYGFSISTFHCIYAQFVFELWW